MGSQMYPGTPASGLVLCLIDQSVVPGETISTVVSKEFPSLLFLSNPSQLFSHLQNHLEGHLGRSQKNPRAVGYSFVYALKLANEAKVRLDSLIHFFPSSLDVIHR